MGLAKPLKTRELMATGPCLANQERAGRDCGRVLNRTDPSLQSEPGPLAGYCDLLLTLALCGRTPFVQIRWFCLLSHQ